MHLEKKLIDGLNIMGIGLSTEQIKTLLAYIALLHKWNKAFNLTAVRQPEAMLTQHILDSLSVLPYIEGKTLLDIGAGPGLPGIPLAIAQPGLVVSLLDSNGKKTRFMQQAVLELGLNQVAVVKKRLEEYRPGQSFDTVISRAFADLNDFVQLSLPLCGSHTQILAMKGRYPQEELQVLDNKVKLIEVKPLQVPGVNAERHLVCLKMLA